MQMLLSKGTADAVVRERLLAASLYTGLTEHPTRGLHVAPRAPCSGPCFMLLFSCWEMKGWRSLTPAVAELQKSHDFCI